MTSAHSSVSGVDIALVALPERGWLDFRCPETTEAPEVSRSAFGADFGVEPSAGDREMRLLVFSSIPDVDGGEIVSGLGLLEVLGGTGGGERRPGDKGEEKEVESLLGLSAPVCPSSFLLLGIAEPVKLHDPDIALARQLELALEMLATVSELFNFSA